MKSVFRNSEYQELIQVKEYPEGFVAVNGLHERDYDADYNSLKEHVHEIMLNGIYIQHRQKMLTETMGIDVMHDFPFLKMQFELKGHSDFRSRVNSIPTVIIPDGQHQLFFLPEVNGLLTYPKSRFTLEINLTIDFLKRVFAQDLSSLEQFGQNIMAGTPTLMGINCLPITPAQKIVIYDIINCTYIGDFRRIYLEAKVVELLILQLDQFNNTYKKQCPSVIRGNDQEKLHYVKELVTNNIRNPYSLVELSEMAGLNNFKLKKGFKELFGNTVFGYLADVRMEQAKTLLLQRSQSIAEISDTVGYKNPQHFTAAFKKKYGYLPSELK